MPILPPTVGERLAKCERQVEVWGIVPGASVDLLVNHVVASNMIVPGSGTVFTLTSDLVENQIVTARQSKDGEASQESPEVEVGNVEIPLPPPRLAPAIYRCAHCVYADGMAPGSTIALLQGDPIEGGEREVGRATADRSGTACFGPGGGLASGTVRGRVTTCSSNAFSVPSEVVEAPSNLPAPFIGSPIFGCQNSINMNGLTQGAGVEVSADTGPIGVFCTCWGAVHVNLPRQLVVGENITGKQTMMNHANNCMVDGLPSAPVPVIPPDSRIKPSIRRELYDGDRLVRVQNQIGGGEITIFIRDSFGAPENNMGRAGASQNEEIALNDPLRAGQIVRASQLLCGRTEFSDPVTVQPRPPTIPPPVVREPLYDCGVLVPVDGVLTGAQVRVFQNGFLIGFAWADGPSVTVRVGPALVQGRTITARQRVGGMNSSPSTPVIVRNLASLPPPTVLAPLRIGQRSVQVGGVVPGAYVRVFDRGLLVGTADAAEATVTVAIGQAIDAGSSITAQQTLCGQSSSPSGPGPTPHADPGEPGGRTPSTPADTPGTPFSVPPSANAPSFGVTIMGELTFPSDPVNPNAVDPNGAPYPLVIIAHGNHRASSPSYQGYRYLTNHLVSHGMICLSINLNDVNGRSDMFTGLDARGLIILEHIRVLLARNATVSDLLHNKIDGGHIGIVGHSRGGEGVVAAQANNLARVPADRFNIRGVVPIAPTNGLDLRHRGAPLFVIYGSADADVSGGDDFVNPFLIYDRSETPKSMIFIHHARHNGFNEVWVRPGEENERILPDSLSPADHQAIAKAYINAFFQSVLLNRPIYDIYLQGPARPLALNSYSIHNQYQVPDRLIVDNFGDDDPQLGLVEQPIDRTSNTLGQSVAYTQVGMNVWFDEEFRRVSQCPHDSRGTQLTWAAAENYRSNLNNRDVTRFNVLSIRLGQQFSTTTSLNPANQPQDLFITLVTSGGEATVRVGSITDVPFPHLRDGLTKAVLKTVRVPLASFRGINPAVRLDQVAAVRVNLGLTSTGAISADDIEFSM